MNPIEIPPRLPAFLFTTLTVLVSVCGAAQAQEQSGEHGPWTRELRLASAPFDEPRAPSVVVHAPPSFDPARPLRLVVFLHGWSGCARVLASEGAVACRDGERTHEGWGLASRFDEASTDALFVVPQLAFLARSGSPGRFVEEGRFRAFLAELLDALPIGDAGLARVESIALLAHSAGFETALALIARGGVPIDTVVLFDALYRGVEPFAAWVSEDPARRLVSLYTGSARTARQSRMLADRARALLGRSQVGYDEPLGLPELVRSRRVVIARSPRSPRRRPGPTPTGARRRSPCRHRRLTRRAFAPAPSTIPPWRPASTSWSSPA